MTREFLQQPMNDIGEDYDQSLSLIHMMLDSVAQALAEAHGVQVFDTQVTSCDNGGVIYSVSVSSTAGTWNSKVALDDDVTMRLLHSDPKGFCAHVERRIELETMPEASGHG